MESFSQKNKCFAGHPSSQSKETFAITRRDGESSDYQTIFMTFGDLGEMLGAPQAGVEKDFAWMPAEITGPHDSPTIAAISLLVLDVEGTPLHHQIDHDPLPSFAALVETLRGFGLACIIQTTNGHQPALPLYRMIFALSRPIAPDELTGGLQQIGQPLVDQLALGEFVDFARHAPDQWFLRPRLPTEQDHFQQMVMEGRSLNVDYLLGKVHHDANTVSCDVRREGEDESQNAAQQIQLLPGFPNGFRCTEEGIEEETKHGFTEICAHLAVTARTQGPHGKWGRVLVFVDHDGHQQQLAISDASLHDRVSNLPAQLASMGFDIVPGKTRSVMQFIGAWAPHERLQSTNRLGWLEGKTGALSFVLPDQVIAQQLAKEVVYQPEWDSSSIRSLQTSGTLEDWKRHVADKACDHPWMLFALCVALASVILAFCGASDSFFVHFWGLTTRGKTTLLQLAASLFGCAFDPNEAPSRSFIRRWNMTINALEGLAEAHSDLPLALDELGSATVNDISPLVYQLCGGEGKAAMNAKRAMQRPRVWRTIAVSSGELSLHQRMSEPSGKGTRAHVVKDGLTHRALDLEVTDIVSTLPETERSAFVMDMKRACATYYGTAGPEFTREIIERFVTGAKVRTHVNEQVAEVMTDIAPSGLSPENARAIRRFALIAVAGELAVELGLLPTVAKVRDVVRTIAVQWLNSVVTLTAEEQIIASIRHYLLVNEAQFQNVTDPTPRNHRVGFVDRKNDRWLFDDQQLCQIIPGTNKKQIVDALKARGFLFLNETDKLKAKCMVASLKKRLGLYAVKGAILGEDASADQAQATGGQPGQPGPAQQPEGAEAVPDAA